MTYNWKRGLGIGLLFVALFLTFTARVLTGAVVGPQPRNLLGILGLLVFVVGILMIFMAKPMNLQGRVDDIIQNYDAGKIDVVHAADELNKIIPIQNIRYRAGKQHTLVGTTNAYPLGLKSGKKAEELAILGYILAIRNNPTGTRYSNIEISRGLSTKHYMRRFLELIEKFKTTHQPDLSTVLGIT